MISIFARNLVPPLATPSASGSDRAFIREPLQGIALWISCRFDVVRTFAPQSGKEAAESQHRDQADEDHASNKSHDTADERGQAYVDARITCAKEDGFEDTYGFPTSGSFEQHAARSFRNRLFTQIGAFP